MPRRLLRAAGDERLVAQLRAGNQAAFEAIYERYHRSLLGYCRHLLGSAGEAEDAIQQVFASAYKALRGPARELELRPWLYAVARNTCISALRKRRAEWPAAAAPPPRSSGQEVEQRAEVRALVSDIATLPEEQRSALVLSELADLAHDEIATVVGCEQAKVKSLVHQARRRLLECRKARDTSCAEVRDTLASLRGGSLRRAWLQLHLRGCRGCREYRGEIQRRRALIALTIPVPSAGLRDAVLAATSGGGTAGGGAAGAGGLAAGGGAPAGGTTGAVTAVGGVTAGGGAAGTGVLSALASPVAAKAAVGLALAGGATAGGLAIRDHVRSDQGDQRARATSAAPEDRGSQSSDADAPEEAGAGPSGAGALADSTRTEGATSIDDQVSRSDTSSVDDDDEVALEEEEVQREPTAEHARAETEEPPPTSPRGRRRAPSGGASPDVQQPSLPEAAEVEAKSLDPPPRGGHRGKLEKPSAGRARDLIEAP